ncbi:hypothetical protein O181_065612 [Austropuccinia psidii MF-1]|uniref:ATP synthase mitochondrial F1 complex assembly factor 1 n=1 Tax=Austropuccinia psidii MF-1 TaxID=1389203 RepID=A0A9Q3I3G0_9BASI|nr:hypothetical protein [Austropuccinia psidii MF-1]
MKAIPLLRNILIHPITSARRIALSSLGRSFTVNARSSNSSVEEKYGAKLKKKLQENGLRNLGELKQLAQKKLEADRASQRKMYDDLIRKACEKSGIDPAKWIGPQKSPHSHCSTRPSSPIKPLDSILNVSKLASESAATITKLWTAYHLSMAQPPRLGAVIPIKTYQEMIRLAKNYPSFVLPLPKSSSAAGKTCVDPPMEMQYLQWDFTSSPLFSPPSASSAVEPTVVMYTPLAQYQLRQAFAQPNLILTHYTDLSESHGIVLMRGDITASKNEPGKGCLTVTEAQLLILRLQQFYYLSDANAASASLSKKRQALLRQFHETPDQFQITELLDLVQDI